MALAVDNVFELVNHRSHRGFIIDILAKDKYDNEIRFEAFDTVRNWYSLIVSTLFCPKLTHHS